jgi:diadenosine tetraphosphate (Ap4A) HIT family hydrolase
MNADCPFCRPAEVLLENDLAYAMRDRFPASPGHLLILSRRRLADWFETSSEERVAMLELADRAKAWLEREFHPDGYNLGINVGEVAGQTIFHVHLHLIPRYRGDVALPRGGVRGVIPNKQSY